MKSALNMNDLIDSVRNKPELWDKNHELYRDKNLKPFLWKEVCRELNWGIGDFEMKSKWNSLRDVFRREQKRSGNSKKKKWEYFDKMSFLDESTSQENVENLNNSSVNNSNFSLIIKTEETTSSTEESAAECSNNDVEMTHTTNVTVVNENNLGKQSTNEENGYEEDDYHFAMSLVPAMKRVPNDRKLGMRMKILQILCEEGETNNFV